MNKRIKKLWVNALLGKGEKKYRQGKGILASKGGYHCCLGVLCRLAQKEKIVSCSYSNNWVYSLNSDILFDGKASILPKSVMKWADLTEADPRVEYDCDEYSLSELNDGNTNEGIKRLSFKEIAKIIDKQL